MNNLNKTLSIELGDYIVIQRQKYTKLQKFSQLDGTTKLGKEELELRGILKQPYGSTFKMCPKESTKRGGRGSQRQNTLQLCTETELRNIRDILGISESGADNRNIRDNGESQSLGPVDIELLRESCNESTEIIKKIVENSKTFHEKTAYSQEKYLKKKEKKYFEFVKIHRPTIRLITEIYFRQDAEKIMSIRMDTLSQIISYSGVCGLGDYLLYESGTNGLLPASILNSIGAQTDATLVHMHPGNIPQKQALLALNLPEEQQNRCISVNIYSVLREFYRIHKNESEDKNTIITGTETNELTHNEYVSSADKESNQSTDNGCILTADMEAAEPSCKKQKLSEIEAEGSNKVVADVIKNDAAENSATPPLKWQNENSRACKLMAKKFDSLVIAAREHPASILKELLCFVKPSRPVVVFSLCKEALTELYVELKTESKVTNLHLTGNWLRMYQILPNRSHPEVNMSGNNGYLLCGYTVS
ncbi:tRNA (adenine(58)-N(1))-methyltransferase non-catalytic subunit TRM6 [Teleopsis dalmanni]|uniref:tRNA (adenine(58)-N(1))-methyltransferase non-catalytic subunit TRM6 n=1 Tax=Teleopsis dalmanni TaxID=139649 RepID=UPI0018CFBA90|nr:tRNA (adenine(58)-N(1))-methyltransferase non-catalytic subunit TRM6 [Teleopsis dalmanni]